LISFDAKLMQIVFVHLLKNAAKYSPEGKKIEIRADVEQGNFVLSVCDEGPGVPEERLWQIFEEFYRLPGTVEVGLGLGLAIVKSIVNLHGGIVTAQNRSTGGMEFRITIPC
jgi:two-component system sensor histidine kinase KdpD